MGSNLSPITASPSPRSHASIKGENQDYLAEPNLSRTGGIDGICSEARVPGELLAEEVVAMASEKSFRAFLHGRATKATKKKRR